MQRLPRRRCCKAQVLQVIRVKCLGAVSVVSGCGKAWFRGCSKFR